MHSNVLVLLIHNNEVAYYPSCDPMSPLALTWTTPKFKPRWVVSFQRKVITVTASFWPQQCGLAHLSHTERPHYEMPLLNFGRRLSATLSNGCLQTVFSLFAKRGHPNISSRPKKSYHSSPDAKSNIASLLPFLSHMGS